MAFDQGEEKTIFSGTWIHEYTWEKEMLSYFTLVRYGVVIISNHNILTLFHKVKYLALK